jgi:hypothetical protein
MLGLIAMLGNYGGAGGTEDVLRRFLASFESSPAAMLGAFEPLRLAPSIRHTCLVALQAAVKVRRLCDCMHIFGGLHGC